jgi:uncharacterized membrane-anchored protein YjiN (DUF445 family)
MKIYLVIQGAGNIVFASRDKQEQLGYVAQEIKRFIKNSRKSRYYPFYNGVIQLLGQEEIEEAVRYFNNASIKDDNHIMFITDCEDRFYLKEIEV